MASNRISKADMDALKKEIMDSLTWELQPDISLNQAAPVQDQWYTVLDTTEDVQIHQIFLYLGTTGETLQLRVTVDGIVFTPSIAANAGTGYYVRKHGYNVDELEIMATSYLTYTPTFLEGRSVKIEARKTTANGNDNLDIRVKWSKRD